jgi:chromosome segregation ATPase
MGVEITIKDALRFLDPEDDNNWTQDGLPRMDVMEQLLDNKDLNRQDVTDADPGFDREKARAMREELKDGLSEERKEETAQETAQVAEQKEVMSLDEEIAQLTKEKEAVDKEIRTRQKRRDQLEQAKAKTHNAKSDTVARQEFIASQARLRGERAQRSRLIMQVVGKDAIDPRCKLDRAMARKTQRGVKRPPVRMPGREG